MDPFAPAFHNSVVTMIVVAVVVVVLSIPSLLPVDSAYTYSVASVVVVVASLEDSSSAVVAAVVVVVVAVAAFVDFVVESKVEDFDDKEAKRRKSRVNVFSRNVLLTSFPLHLL